MERNVVVKLVGAILFLGWIAFAMYWICMRQLNSMFSGIRRVDPPTWYEIAIRHPALYLGLCASAVMVFVGWQVYRREAVWWSGRRIDPDDSVWTYWSILSGESAIAAMFVHLTIYATIGG